MLEEDTNTILKDKNNYPKDKHGDPISGGPWIRMVNPKEVPVSKDNENRYVISNDLLYLTQVERRLTPTAHGTHINMDHVDVYAAPNNEMNKSVLIQQGYKQGWYDTPELANESPELQNAVRPSINLSQALKTDFSYLIPRNDKYRIDGIKYKAGDGPENQVPLVTTDATKLGTFNLKNGFAVLVTPNGNTYLRKENEALYSQLNEAGFRYNPYMEVPFAHGEKPVTINDKTAHLLKPLTDLVEEVQSSGAYNRGRQAELEESNGLPVRLFTDGEFQLEVAKHSLGQKIDREKGKGLHRHAQELERLQAEYAEKMRSDFRFRARETEKAAHRDEWSMLDIEKHADTPKRAFAKLRETREWKELQQENRAISRREAEQERAARKSPSKER